MLVYNTKMENDQIRKKVYMQTHRSSLISPRRTLLPQWISESQLSFTSAYEFCTYNVEAESMEMLARGQGQAEALLTCFKTDSSDLQNELYYVYKEQQRFYLGHQPQDPPQRLLLFRKDVEQKSKIVQQFLDYIILNHDEPVFSSRNMLSRTQRLIEEYREDEQQEQCEFQCQLLNITGLQVIFECSFAIAMVEMKKVNGLMLVNLPRAQRETEREYRCGFATIDLGRCEPQLSQGDSIGSRLVYLFPERLLEVHRTSDITQFVFLTEQHLLLAKINYDLMELCILHKIKTTRPRSRLICAGVCRAGEDDYISAVAETRLGSSKNIKSGRRFLRLFRIEDRRIIEVKTQPHYANAPKYECEEGRTLKFLDESQKNINIKFSTNVVQSHYQISDSEEEEGVGFNSNIIMSVFNSMLNEEGRTQQKILFDKEAHRDNLFHNNIKQLTQSKTPEKSTIKDIAGVIANKNLIIVWEKEDAVMHLCRILTAKEIEERHQKQKQSEMSKNSNKILLKEREMKDIYAQLMGNALPPKQETMLDLESRIQYIRRVEVDLSCHKITSLSLSPNNYNLLVVASSGDGAVKQQPAFQGSSSAPKESLSYWVFQLQLFTQLSNPDPNMFLKGVQHVYKNKPTEHIATSLVREMPVFLTGNLVHSMEGELIEGALSFDIHPYHLFLAVSFGFTTKVYALEGTERLSSLHTINLQGVKQVRYSPLGNHLCLLSSKCIRVIDAYSFMLKFTIHEKYSSFAKCFFSSSGLELYTISENHATNVYNSFDYTKTDSFKLAASSHDAKPIQMASFTKHLQYCLVLENGQMVVRYKQEAIVVTHDNAYKYLDNEKITSIEIDEKNGILFVGCGSGKLRAHLWPMKDDQNFDVFSQIRIGFAAIQSLALSNLNYFLYVGCANGNTSKVKFVIDRDRGTVLSPSHNPLFTESNLKYVNMSGNSNIQKVYKFVLANSSSVNQELPQKVRLQYKLSQVISKLNEQMHKLKSQIKQQIQQKIKMNSNRFDINLYHHLNKMITTKLSTQYNEEQDANHRDIEQLKENYNKQMKEVLANQNDLVQQKSLLISNNVATRNRLKEDYTNQLQELGRTQEEELKKLERKVTYQEKKGQCQDEEVYYLPACSYDYEEEARRLTAELQSENRQYYELRKECAYKQTAIKGMTSKKLKEESLQFKFQLQTGEMRKKYEYSRGVAARLRGEIQEAEEKVHVMQTQASIIKSNAQFKKVANVEEMNDACSYKLYVKEKTEKEIHELCVHLRFLEEFLEGKSSEMVDLIVCKGDRQGQIDTLKQRANDKKQKLKLTSLTLLGSKNKVKRISKNDYAGLLSANFTPRAASPSSAMSTDRPANRPLQKSQSSRQMAKSNKDVSLFNSIMEKQMNFLKTTMKIHTRKLNNFGKENGELLTEYQKLKYENKTLLETQQKETGAIKTLKKELKGGEGGQVSARNVEVQLVKTSFQRYLQNKESKMGHKYKTAVNTPSRQPSPTPSDQD